MVMNGWVDMWVMCGCGEEVGDCGCGGGERVGSGWVWGEVGAWVGRWVGGVVGVGSGCVGGWMGGWMSGWVYIITIHRLHPI